MIVLDTHAWVWFVSNPDLLSEEAGKAADNARNRGQIFVSSISAWEVALLAAKRRLSLTMDVNDWIARSEMLPFIRFIPVNNDIAVRSVNLPQPLHNDPADRIIIATAIITGFPLVTKDRKISDYPHVQTIW